MASSPSGIPEGLLEEDFDWGLDSDSVDVLAPGEEPVDYDPEPMEEDPSTPPTSPGKKAMKAKNAEIARLRSRIEQLELEKGKEGKDKVPPLKLSPPALFTGKRGSFEYFASKLKSFAELTRVPEDRWVALAVQQLDEKPTKVWEAHKKKLERECAEITWDVFHKFMSSRYDSSDLVTQARQKLDKVYQGSEGVERYIERFMSLLADVETEYDICEPDKIHLFLRGLETPLKLACTVNPGTGKPFEDLDTLCTFVVRYETSLKAAGNARGGQGGDGPKKARLSQFRYGNPPIMAPAYGPPSPFVLGAVQPPAGKVDSRTSVPPDRQCYFCRELGHEAWQCAKKKEYLAKRAKQSKHQPVHYQPGYYPPYGVHPPVAAPIVPWGAGYHWGPVQGGIGKSGRRGKNGKGKGKGKGAQPGKAA